MPYAASWPGKKWLSKRRGKENEKDSVSGFWCALLGIAVAACFASAATAQEVHYKRYIELGDAGAFGTKDQMIVAWQTDESAPNPSGYTVEFGTTPSYGARSEERRVGKECRSRWSPYH